MDFETAFSNLSLIWWGVAVMLGRWLQRGCENFDGGYEFRIATLRSVQLSLFLDG